MKHLVASLDSYKDAVENAKSFTIEVNLCGGKEAIQSSALPIDTFEQVMSDLEDSSEVGAVTIWNRHDAALVIVPMEEVSYVIIRFNKTA